MIKGAIFDVDGTILDSMEIWTKADEVYLKNKGFIATENLSKLFSTLTLEKSIEYMQKHFHIQDSKEKMIHDILAIVQEFYFEEVKLKEGMIEILDYFKENHIPMVIATSNQKNLIEKTFEKRNILSYFMYILTSDEFHTTKDKPDLFYEACRFLNTKPEETLVFEDSLHAIETVSKYGFQVVGVYDDYSINEQASIKKLSHYYLSSKQEIKHFIKSMKLRGE